MSEEVEVKKVEVTPDELKIVMAYRYREELAELEAECLKRVALCAGRETLTPEQVRALCNATTVYDELLTKCGYLPELEVESEAEAEAEEEEPVDPVDEEAEDAEE